MTSAGTGRRSRVHEAVSEALGEEVTPDTGVDRAAQARGAAGHQLEPKWNAGQVLLELYEHLVEAKTRAADLLP